MLRNLQAIFQSIQQMQEQHEAQMSSEENKEYIEQLFCAILILYFIKRRKPQVFQLINQFVNVFMSDMNVKDGLKMLKQFVDTKQSFEQTEPIVY